MYPFLVEIPKWYAWIAPVRNGPWKNDTHLRLNRDFFRTKKVNCLCWLSQTKNSFGCFQELQRPFLPFGLFSYQIWTVWLCFIWINPFHSLRALPRLNILKVFLFALVMDALLRSSWDLHFLIDVNLSWRLFTHNMRSFIQIFFIQILS